MTIQSCPSGGNLWQRALDAVYAETRTSLASIISDYKGGIITKTLEEAEKKKNLCLEKRWKVEFRGKTIILGDLLDKVIA